VGAAPEEQKKAPTTASTADSVPRRSEVDEARAGHHQVKGVKTSVKDVRDLARRARPRESRHRHLDFPATVHQPNGTEAASVGFYEHKTNKKKFRVSNSAP